jgi:hypothetical protein
MVAAADNNSNGRCRWWWMTTVADNDGVQDWAADYDREGQERAVNNDNINVGIRLNLVGNSNFLF